MTKEGKERVEQKEYCGLEFSVLQALCRHYDTMVGICDIRIGKGNNNCTSDNCPFVDIYECEVLKGD